MSDWNEQLGGSIDDLLVLWIPDSKITKNWILFQTIFEVRQKQKISKTISR